MSKYQTKYINEKLDQLWKNTKEIKDAELAVVFMELIAEVRKSINDTEEEEG